MPDVIDWFQLFRESGHEWVIREEALVYTFKLSRERKAFIKALCAELWMGCWLPDDYHAVLKANRKYAVAIRYKAFHLWIETVVRDSSENGEEES